VREEYVEVLINEELYTKSYTEIMYTHFLLVWLLRQSISLP